MEMGKLQREDPETCRDKHTGQHLYGSKLPKQSKEPPKRIRGNNKYPPLTESWEEYLFSPARLENLTIHRAPERGCKSSCAQLILQ